MKYEERVLRKRLADGERFSPVDTDLIPGVLAELDRLRAELASAQPPRPVAIMVRSRLERMIRIDAYEDGHNAHDAWMKLGDEEGDLLFIGTWTWHPRGG